MLDSSTAPTQRAAIYARVSSEEQREGQTIDSQIAELERFAEGQGWDVVGVYKDEGWSGALLSRPELDRLRDDAARKRFDLVLLNDVDRLARDVAHLGIVKRDLERGGVRVVFRKLPHEVSPTYNLMVNVLGSFAEFEREMIADRTRRGRRHKVEVRQQFLGSVASYGYRYVPKNNASGRDGYLEIVPDEAALVRQMYEWVGRESLSVTRVAARLNESGSRPRKGGKWAKSTVLRILRNETYAGVWHYNKHYGSESQRPGARSKYRRSLKSSSRLRPRADWLPVALPEEIRVVPRDLWERVQQQLTKNVSFSPRNTKHSYLLKGLVRCGGCGSVYVGDPNHGRYYYRCRNRCHLMPAVKEETLDGAVWEAVKQAVLEPGVILEQVGRLRERESVDERVGAHEAESINRETDRMRREEARLLEAYRAGIISPAQLGQQLEQLKQRRNALEVRAAGIRKSGSAADGMNLRRTLEDYCRNAALRMKTFDDAERQRFLRLLVDNVIFEGERVRIRAVIPLRDDADHQSSTRQTGEVADPGGNVITTTDTHQRARNSGRTGFMDLEHYGRNSVGGENRIEDTEIDTRGPNEVRQHYSESGVFEAGSFVRHVSFELCRALPEKQFSILSDEGLKLVRRLKLEEGDATLLEMCARVRRERGREVSVSHMSRALRRFGMSPVRRGPKRTNQEELGRAA
jgi:site-specific DNA recombinase